MAANDSASMDSLIQETKALLVSKSRKEDFQRTCTRWEIPTTSSAGKSLTIRSLKLQLQSKLAEFESEDPDEAEDAEAGGSAQAEDPSSKVPSGRKQLQLDPIAEATAAGSGELAALLKQTLLQLNKQEARLQAIEANMVSANTFRRQAQERAAAENEAATLPISKKTEDFSRRGQVATAMAARGAPDTLIAEMQALLSQVNAHALTAQAAQTHSQPSESLLESQLLRDRITCAESAARVLATPTALTLERLLRKSLDCRPKVVRDLIKANENRGALHVLESLQLNTQRKLVDETATPDQLLAVLKRDRSAAPARLGFGRAAPLSSVSAQLRGHRTPGHAHHRGRGGDGISARAYGSCRLLHLKSGGFQRGGRAVVPSRGRDLEVTAAHASLCQVPADAAERNVAAQPTARRAGRGDSIGVICKTSAKAAEPAATQRRRRTELNGRRRQRRTRLLPGAHRRHKQHHPRGPPGQRMSGREGTRPEEAVGGRAGAHVLWPTHPHHFVAPLWPRGPALFCASARCSALLTASRWASRSQLRGPSSARSG